MHVHINRYLEKNVELISNFKISYRIIASVLDTFILKLSLYKSLEIFYSLNTIDCFLFI